jgi:pimeloyl-ACP methyl ester carboxylesterase
VAANLRSELTVVPIVCVRLYERFTRAFLVGHDIEDMVAYVYAAQHPQEVQTMAILDVLLLDENFLELKLLIGFFIAVRGG